MIRPVILCGGAGTRLWPVSRELFPKQLLPVTSEQSLLQQTATRLTGNDFAPAVVVGGEGQRYFIKRQMEDVGAAPEAILLEPSGRNTAAAATLAAAWLATTGRNDLLLLMPSDHVILNPDAFLRALAAGKPYAEAGAIVTFGARPSEPNTQYGYIEAGSGRPADAAVPIARFVEKPDSTTAAEYLASGRFYWNAGIFLLKASTLLDQMREFLPESLAAIENAVANAQIDGLFVRPNAEQFGLAQNISIDHGIMENTSRGMVVPVDMGWSDVGAWDAVWKLADKDPAGNAIRGDVVTFDTSNSLIRSDGGPLVAAVGLDRMAVVAVRDAILIAPMDRVADVKDVVQALKAGERECATSPSRVSRPWGTYESIAQGPGFQVKQIVVDPGERLSLQSHVHRSEHWVVVRGLAEVTVGEEVSILQANQSAYIPAGTKHRLANPGNEPLEIVEVQCGSYLGEDDIQRFEDIYGRAPDDDRGEPNR